jgi:hypothetical protein
MEDAARVTVTLRRRRAERRLREMVRDAVARETMPDFVAILRRAIEGLEARDSPSREHIYSRARVALARRLEAVSPMPPALAERQTQYLEEAIAEVEREYSGLTEDQAVEAALSGLPAGPDPKAISPPSAVREDIDATPPPLASMAVTLPTCGFDITGNLSTHLAATMWTAANEVHNWLKGSEHRSVHQLEWATSGKCAVCNMWALCVDARHCWHRIE